MIALLTARETLAQSTPAHRFMVEVASDNLDLEGVPIDCQIIDVCIAAPSREAIELLVAATDWLKGYSLKSFWQPEDGCTEF